MTLLDPCWDKISDIVAYSFWKTQYRLRANPDEQSIPKYNPSATELCRDLCGGVKKDPGALHSRINLGMRNCECLAFGDDSLTINIKKPMDINVVMREVELLIYVFAKTERQSNGDLHVMIDDDFHRMNNNLTRAIIYSNTKIAFDKNRWGARALGMWLWDYVQEHGGMKKRGIVASAIRAMKNHLGQEIKELGFADTEESVFRRFCRRTAECIDACEVLSFK